MYLPMTVKRKENGGESQENQRKPSEIISCLGNDFQRLVGIGGTDNSRNLFLNRDSCSLSSVTFYRLFDRCLHLYFNSALLKLSDIVRMFTPPC
jgi:hypothetical protein